MSFTPGDIRPAALEEGKTREIQRDIEWLAARRERFISVACPACGRSGEYAFEKFGFTFDECPACRTVFMTPRATSAIMAEFYQRSATYEFWDKYVFPASRDVRKTRVFQPRVDRIVALCKAHGIDTGAALDVGAAIGLFCEALRDAALFGRLVALEPNKAQAETCRRVGLETLETDFFALDRSAGPFNLITAFEVIEHLFSPADFLARCRDLLCPRGLVVVTCPNQLGFDIQTLGEDSESFDVEHVNMFNPSSLIDLFERSGFEVLEASTPGEMDAAIVRDAVLSGRLALNDQPFLRQVLIDRWDDLGAPFQVFLKTNGLSSHLWLAARKR